MQSALKDIYNCRPEQLSSFDTFINYTSTGLIAGAIGLPLDFNRAYIFTKVKTCIGLFVNAGSTLIAFPNFEQFQLPLEFKLEVATSANARTDTLCREMRDLYTDGRPHAHTFETPFSVVTNNKQGAQVLITVSCNDSLTNTVRSISTGIPTAPGVCFVDGLFILEGYSMPISEYNKLQKKLVI